MGLLPYVSGTQVQGTYPQKAKIKGRARTSTQALQYEAQIAQGFSFFLSLKIYLIGKAELEKDLSCSDSLLKWSQPLWLGSPGVKSLMWVSFVDAVPRHLGYLLLLSQGAELQVRQPGFQLMLTLHVAALCVIAQCWSPSNFLTTTTNTYSFIIWQMTLSQGLSEFLKILQHV